MHELSPIIHTFCRVDMAPFALTLEDEKCMRGSSMSPSALILTVAMEQLQPQLWTHGDTYRVCVYDSKVGGSEDFTNYNCMSTLYFYYEKTSL